MKKLNKGIYTTPYVLGLYQRGHVKHRLKDFRITFKGALVERIGFIRDEEIVIYWERFISWVRFGIRYTPSAKKYLSKFAAYFDKF